MVQRITDFKYVLLETKIVQFFFLYFCKCLCVLCLQANESLNVFNEMTKSVAAIVKLCLCCLLAGLFHLSRWIDVQVKSVMTSYRIIF